MGFDVCEINAISNAIENMLEEYADLTFEVTDKALDAGAKVLINNLKVASPIGTTGAFKKSWKQKKKYKMKRYVGNAKMVKTKDTEIPLSNILEYSTKHVNPFIKQTYNNSVDQIAAAIVDEIKKGI